MCRHHQGLNTEVMGKKKKKTPRLPLDPLVLFFIRVCTAGPSFVAIVLEIVYFLFKMIPCENVFTVTVTCGGWAAGEGAGRSRVMHETSPSVSFLHFRDTTVKIHRRRRISDKRRS